MKFFTKLMLLAFTIIVITGTTIYYFVYTSNIKTLEAEIKDRLEDQAFHIMDKIDRVLYERRADIQIVATDPIISSRDSNPRQITERLIKFRNIYKTYISLSFFDLNRIRIADTAGLDIGRQHPIEIYWKDLLEGEISAGSEIAVSKALKIPVIFFASPVKDRDGKIFGFVVARTPLGKLYEITRLLTGIHEEEEEFGIDLVDKNGLLLYSNYNKNGMLKDNYRDLESVKRSMAGEKIGSLIQAHFLLKKEKDICVFVHEQGYLDFKGNDWTLLVHVPTKTVFAPAIELRNKIIIILMAILMGAVLAIFFITKIITKPIAELSNAVAKVGKGELDTKIGIKTKDEIGQLATAFKKMAENLQKTTVSRDSLIKEIDERKKVEEKLWNAAEAWRTTFDSIFDMVSIHDKDFKIVRVNKAFANMFKVQPQELLGKICYELVHGTKEPPSTCPHKQTLDTKKPGRGEYFEPHLGIYLGVSTSPIFDEKGEVIGSVHIAKDISVRKNGEEKLDQALKEALKSREILTSMLDDNNQTREQLEKKLEASLPRILSL